MTSRWSPRSSVPSKSVLHSTSEGKSVKIKFTRITFILRNFPWYYWHSKEWWTRKIIKKFTVTCASSIRLENIYAKTLQLFAEDLPSFFSMYSRMIRLKNSKTNIRRIWSSISRYIPGFRFLYKTTW